MAAPWPGEPASPFATCPNLGYQMQSPDGLHSDFGNFDLNTARLNEINDIESPVNAFGYSRTQKVFWGMFTNSNPDTLVRIDSAGNYNYPGYPLTGIAGDVITNTGTIGRYQGKEALFLHTQLPVNELVIVDIDPDGGVIGDVLARKPLSRATTGMNFLRIGDWDFNPSDGLLYSLEMEGDTIRRLVTVDPDSPATATVADVKDLSDRLPDGHNYGAVYVEDVSGTIYVSNNDVNDILDNGGTDGFSQTFGYYPDQDVVIAYTPGTRNQALLINDGADCLVATDFGDAPDTFQTLNPNGGPGHIFSEVGDPNTTTDSYDDARQLRIGALIDPDLDGIPSADATGDDLNLPVNDEDGVPAGTVLDAAGAMLTVPVTNTTGAAATLAGWIDFNGSGTFEASERAMVSVPAGGGSVVLQWAPTAATVSDTFLRLRLYSGADPLAADPQPSGAAFAVGGEIEDHRISLSAMPVTGSNTGDLVKAGLLLVVCGGLGFMMGSGPAGGSRRRPSPRPRKAAVSA
jgi:hypothetical protein